MIVFVFDKLLKDGVKQIEKKAKEKAILEFSEKLKDSCYENSRKKRRYFLFTVILIEVGTQTAYSWFRNIIDKELKNS